MDATAAAKRCEQQWSAALPCVGFEELSSNKKTPHARLTPSAAAYTARKKPTPRATAEANTAKKKYDPPRANEGRHLAY